MKVLILFGLIAVAAAYPTSIQQTYGPGSDCVIIEYHLGYTTLEFEACDRPRDCLQGIETCPSNCQLTPIGAPQFIVLGQSPNFKFYNVLLFAGTCSSIQDTFCLSADPELQNCKDPGYAPFYRYWNGRDHFYTTNINEIGTATRGQTGKHGFTSEGTQCIIRRRQVSGSIPLYRYWNGRDHFYTTNAGEIGVTTPGAKGNHGYTSEGTAGYCFRSRVQNTIPLYRYYNPSNGDHFYTTNANEIGTTTRGQTGNHGYRSEGIQCYVDPN